MTNHQAIIERITKVPMQQGRRIIAIAGGPASGKSTLSAELQVKIPNSCVVPMDGFHKSNEDLERHGLLARKGAPETFDVAGFISLIKTLRGQGDVFFPTFDRTQDCVIPNGGNVERGHETILVEGNYLLLDMPQWDTLAAMWDFAIFLDVPSDVLQNRLIERWVQHGLDLPAATMRAEQNDLPNARLTRQKALPADLRIEVG